MVKSLSNLLRRHRLKFACLIAVFAALWIIGDTFFEDDNFRVVTSDLYRSGQLRSDEWSESFDEYRYRSVINLRGGGPSQSWYDLEQSFAQSHGVAHYDFALSDREEPSLQTLRGLVALMKSAPKPLLIHCRAGADRSGLAAALYLFAVNKRSAEEAAGQLSIWYGHFPWLISKTGAMDRAFAAFTAAERQQLGS